MTLILLQFNFILKFSKCSHFVHNRFSQFFFLRLHKIISFFFCLTSFTLRFYSYSKHSKWLLWFGLWISCHVMSHTHTHTHLPIEKTLVNIGLSPEIPIIFISSFNQMRFALAEHFHEIFLSILFERSKIEECRVNSFGYKNAALNERPKKMLR